MTRQRIILLLLAIVLVYAGTIAILQIPYQRIYQNIMNPRADAEDVQQQVQSPDVLTRRQGLDAYHYGLQDDNGVMDALVQTVLNDTDKENRQRALKILVGKTSAQLSQQKKQAPLDTSDINQIVSLITDENISQDLFWSLILFAANTAQWQSYPQPIIDRISGLLTETSPVAGEERSAAYAREEKRRTVLQALKGYARYMMLPDQLLETLLPVYTTVPASRLRPEVGYIYQYHAINGPLPPAVRQAVIDTMQNSDDKNLRLTAIMTMEWIGKQEGRIPQEMLDSLNTNDDAWTRNHFNHVIIRMQKHSKDPLASLLAVVQNGELPDSIRANALREAGKDYAQDKRYSDTVFNLTRANEASLRAAAIQLLPDETEHTAILLSYIDAALADTNPGIRIIALGKLVAIHVPDSEKLSRLEQALTDTDTDVLSAASLMIKNSGLSSDTIQERLAHLARTGQLQQIAEKPSPGLWKTFVETAGDTRQHGLRLFWALAATGVVIAAGFAIYYVYRILIYIQQRNRRGYTAIGVLVVWAGLTWAMVVLFFFGAFSFGHNYLVAPRSQFIIDAVMGSALLVYGFLGWVMHKLVRR